MNATAATPLATSVHVTCCCAQRPLGAHRAALLVGDSLLRRVTFADSGSLCGEQKSQVRCEHIHLQSTCNTTAIAYYDTPSASGLVPSRHNASHVLHTTRTAGFQMLPTLVVHSFSSLHLLHLHPARPWYEAADSEGRCSKEPVVPGNMCADFAGNLGLERWVTRDLAAYRTQARAQQLIVASPNAVCSSRYGGAYAAFLNQTNGAVLAAPCVAYAERHRGGGGEGGGGEREGGAPRGPWQPPAAACACGTDASRPDDAGCRRECSPRTFCLRNMLDGVGASYMTRRLELAARAGRATFFNMHAISHGRCNETFDGRHYSQRVVELQASALRGLCLQSLPTSTRRDGPGAKMR